MRKTTATVTDIRSAKKSRTRTRTRGHLNEEEIRILRQLIEFEGLEFMAKEIGVSAVTLLRVCAGWMDRCNARSKQTVLAFFGDS